MAKIRQNCQNEPENKPENVYKNKKKCPQTGTFPILVEVRGVEPITNYLNIYVFKHHGKNRGKNRGE